VLLLKRRKHLREDTPTLLKKHFSPGWSKTTGCKAREIKRNEAYFTVLGNDPESYWE
jgi:hypothetical protein